MFPGALGRRGLGLLTRARHGVCCSQQTIRLPQPTRQLHALSSNPKAILPLAAFASAVSTQRAQQDLRRLRTSQTFAYSTEEEAVAQQDVIVDHVEGPVHPAEYQTAYVNFFALTGVLDRAMSSYQRSNGDYKFQIRVYTDGEQQSQMFEVEAQGAVAAAISANLEKLPEGALLSIVGVLAQPQEGYTRLKVAATHVGYICYDIPEHIATATANLKAWRSAGGDERVSAAAGSGPALIPGEGGMPVEASNDHEAMWMELFMNPGSYYDNRLTKRGNQPDFKCKSDSDKALWIDGWRTPRWVMDNLQLLPGNIPYEQSRATAQSQPYTPTQPGVNQYDFMPAQASQEKEALWMDVFNKYNGWWDNRANKRNDRQPDFKNRSNGDAALWIDSRTTPQWVTKNIDSALPSPPPPLHRQPVPYELVVEARDPVQ